MAKKVAQPHGGEVQIWERGESGNPNGRPRQVLRLLEEKAAVEFNVCLSKEDKFIILESLLEMPLADLKRIASDTKAPAFLVTAAKAIVSDASKGSINVLLQLFDRLFGKPQQTTEITAAFSRPVFNGFDFLKPLAAEPIEDAQEMES